jgi:plastocyanin
MTRIRIGLFSAMLLFAGTPAMHSAPQGYSQTSPVRFAGRIIYIFVQDHSFAPATITVSPGTTIHWINLGKQVHTVTSNAAFFNSGDMPPGSIYSVLFTQLGTHEYHCRHHDDHGMRGTIHVRIEPFAPPGY